MDVKALWHGLFWSVALWSGAAPADRLTWWLEAAPALAIYAVLLGIRRRFQLTPLAAWLCLLLIAIIFVGGHYGFAAVPGFEGPRALTDGSGARNEFDKFAHFFQGLVPAIVFRELLIRGRVLSSARILPALVIALALALSALYELFEWVSQVVLGPRAAAFIAAQDDPWDAQSDMALALLGAVAALSGLSRWHDADLAALASTGSLRDAKNSFDNTPFRG